MLKNRSTSLTTLVLVLLLVAGTALPAAAQKMLIPMGASQTNHLKAYGIVFNHLQDGNSVQWLLNYNGGSFLLDYSESVNEKCLVRNVKNQRISASKARSIIQKVEQPDANMAVTQLDKAPKIAVYTPKQKLPWDDAVTLALTYAEVEYDKVWDEEVLNG